MDKLDLAGGRDYFSSTLFYSLLLSSTLSVALNEIKVIAGDNLRLQLVAMTSSQTM